MVVSGHPLATAAGLHVLMDSGNAVDAALAASGVLAVVRPAWCSVGGDGFGLIYTPDGVAAVNGSGAASAVDGNVVAVNGSGAAPLAAQPEAFPEGRVPRFGPRSVAVPGLVDAWALAASSYATRPLADLLAPAIQYARAGFRVDGAFARAIQAVVPGLAEWPSLARLLAASARAGGDVPQPGDLYRQPELADTLALIGQQGHDAFYRGSLATAIADTLTARGGLLAPADLARHTTAWQPPLAAEYRGHTIYEQPPVSQGCLLLQELNVLGGCDVQALGHESPALIDLLVRCKLAAFAAGARHLGDPAAVDVPLDRLLSAEWAAEQRAAIAAALSAAAAPSSPDPAPVGGGTDTDCLVVADGEGRIVCWIQSLFNLFGAREVVDGTGIVLNDRLANLPLDQARPNALRPGYKPLHTLNTFLACRDGQPVLAGATPGGQGQVQTNLQLIVNVLDFGLDMQAAVDAPRWVSGSPTPGDTTLYLEPRFAPALADALRARGHTVALADGGADDERFGSATLLSRDPATGTYSGGADPRREAHALGW
jgi:gamma-glutamyltranspeptidase/glutathione hydrolase